jgi:pimeloyl-ACP methyl ester carboxylesterase
MENEQSLREAAAQSHRRSTGEGARILLSYRVYRNSSSAEWIIFVPGAGASAAIWGPQLRVFRRDWNVIVVELRGHGRSPKSDEGVIYTFALTGDDILGVMDHEGIQEAHFVAMSLGGMLVETMAARHPERVKSMVLAGGIAELRLLALVIMRAGQVLKRFLPYLWLYRLFAWVIMPGPRHRNTRRLFHSQAKRLSKGEFLRWYRLTEDVQDTLRLLAGRPEPIPTLFVMGENDYMFLRYAHDRTECRQDTSIAVLENAGHVCTVERPDAFNQVALAFIERVAETSAVAVCGSSHFGSW